MENEFELGVALERLIRVSTRGKTMVDGLIQDVDESDFTCTVSVAGTVFSGVPLKVLVGSKASIIEIPTAGTACLVGFRDGDQQRPQIMQVNEVDKYYINPDNFTQFGDGSNGGMMLLMPSLAAFNALQNDVNLLKANFRGWIPVPNDGGAALKAATSGWAGNQLQVTQRSDIENTQITQ